MCQGQKGLQKLNDFLTHVSAPPAGKGGAVSAFEGTGRTVARICSGVTAAGRAVGTLLQDAQCGISVLVHTHGVRKQAPFSQETGRPAVINTIELTR
jgi:hypothetical protein